MTGTDLLGNHLSYVRVVGDLVDSTKFAQLVDAITSCVNVGAPR